MSLMPKIVINSAEDVGREINNIHGDLDDVEAYVDEGNFKDALERVAQILEAVTPIVDFLKEKGN